LFLLAREKDGKRFRRFVVGGKRKGKEEERREREREGGRERESVSAVCEARIEF